MLRRIRRHFLTGLAAGLPLATTVVVVWFLVTLLGSILGPLLARVPGLAALPRWLLSLIGFVVMLLLTTALGALTAGIVGRRLVAWLDHLMQRLPLARDLYGSARQLTDAVFVRRSSLRRAVIVEYPRKGMYAVGFLTAEEPLVLPDGRRTVGVFIPSTPNPTTGWLALVPEADAMESALTIEEALKLVVSGGMVRPAGRGAPDARTDA
ncbi:DUF502 domain-containing protein [candidate division WOR-3 bacterium]|nr:DUF502 domain-containing protein [candidate division WOR-3 bacterium]